MTLSDWPRRMLARQFARPSGLAGRWLIGPMLDRIGRAMNRLAFDELEVRPGERVLEVGFGGGELLARLLAARAEVVGIDRSEAMLGRARLRFARELRDGRLTLHQASVERLPLAADSVDRACSVNAIYFWPDLTAAAAELVRVLRPGGTLLLCFQLPDSVRSWPGHRYGFIAHEPEQVRAAMMGAGVRLAEEKGGSDDRVGRFLCLKGVRE